MNIIAIIAALLLFCLLVASHEFGHYAAAKLLAARGIPAMLVTHFNHIWSSLQEAFAAEGLEDRLHSLVMRTEAGPEGPRYLYRLEEAPPPPSSHARAVAARKGVTLEGMLSGLEARGLDVRPGDPGWAKLRQGIL